MGGGNTYLYIHDNIISIFRNKKYGYNTEYM